MQFNPLTNGDFAATRSFYLPRPTPYPSPKTLHHTEGNGNHGQDDPIRRVGQGSNIWIPGAPFDQSAGANIVDQSTGTYTAYAPSPATYLGYNHGMNIASLTMSSEPPGQHLGNSISLSGLNTTNRDSLPKYTNATYEFLKDVRGQHALAAHFSNQFPAPAYNSQIYRSLDTISQGIGSEYAQWLQSQSTNQNKLVWDSYARISQPYEELSWPVPGAVVSPSPILSPERVNANWTSPAHPDKQAGSSQQTMTTKYKKPKTTRTGDGARLRGKKSKNIRTISLGEAEEVVGVEIRRYYGTKGQSVPNDLLWKTRVTVDGKTALKRKSKCKFCSLTSEGSSALYHARRHLDICSFVCPQNGCGRAFVQQSDLNIHSGKIHDQGSPQSIHPPSSSSTEEITTPTFPG